MNKDLTLNFIESHWESWFIKGLSDFVRIPNLTPMVDPEYLSNGLLEQAIDCVDSYIRVLEIKGISRQIYKADSGLPLICYVIEPSSPDIIANVLVYGHLDK